MNIVNFSEEFSFLRLYYSRKAYSPTLLATMGLEKRYLMSLTCEVKHSCKFSITRYSHPMTE